MQATEIPDNFLGKISMVSKIYSKNFKVFAGIGVVYLIAIYILETIPVPQMVLELITDIFVYSTLTIALIIITAEVFQNKKPSLKKLFINVIKNFWGYTKAIVLSSAYAFWPLVIALAISIFAAKVDKHLALSQIFHCLGENTKNNSCDNIPHNIFGNFLMIAALFFSLYRASKTIFIFYALLLEKNIIKARDALRFSIKIMNNFWLKIMGNLLLFNLIVGIGIFALGFTLAIADLEENLLVLILLPVIILSVVFPLEIIFTYTFYQKYK